MCSCPVCMAIAVADLLKKTRNTVLCTGHARMPRGHTNHNHHSTEYYSLSLCTTGKKWQLLNVDRMPQHTGGRIDKLDIRQAPSEPHSPEALEKSRVVSHIFYAFRKRLVSRYTPVIQAFTNPGLGFIVLKG